MSSSTVRTRLLPRFQDRNKSVTEARVDRKRSCACVIQYFKARTQWIQSWRSQISSFKAGIVNSLIFCPFSLVLLIQSSFSEEEKLKCVIKSKHTTDASQWTSAMSELHLEGRDARIQGGTTESGKLSWRELVLYQHLTTDTEIYIQKHLSRLRDGKRARQLVKRYCCMIVYCIFGLERSF